jgi:hypothetical protein
VVTHHELWYRYVPESGHWYDGTCTRKIEAFSAATCMPLAGRGRDAQGNYVALGFGLEACQTFLQAQSNGLDMAYRHWLTGYPGPSTHSLRKVVCDCTSFDMERVKPISCASSQIAAIAMV